MQLRSTLATLERELAKRQARTGVRRASYPQYAHDPLGYIRHVLRLRLTPGQVAVVEALLSHRKVLVSSGHSVGKSMLGACLVNWWFDCRYPGLCLTTAPTDRQVKQILWKEIRELRSTRNLPDAWVGPKTPMLMTGPHHFAHGFTARDATRFQGQHGPGGLLILFDEAEGIEVEFWRALKTMLDDDSYFIAFYNPTTPGSAAHMAERQADEHGTFKRITLSCLEHPNVAAQLQGCAPPIPGAINLGQLREMLLEDSTVLQPGDEPEPGDVELDGTRYRPGPVAQARALGRRPTTSTTGLWGERLWKQVLATRYDVHPEWPVVIGCDVARYGDDQTSLWVRKGYCLLHAEVHGGWPTNRVAERLKELCWQYEDPFNPRKQIPVHVDEGGIGGGVIDQGDDHTFIAVNASRRARNPRRFFNVRSEVWYTARDAARAGLVDVSRIPAHLLTRLEAELTAARYEIHAGTDKVRVASKDDMKVLLGKSPDLADGFNLVLYPPEVIRE